MKSLRILFVFTFSLVLISVSACTNKKAPGCNDDSTKEKTMKIFAKQIIPQQFKLEELDQKGMLKYSNGKLELVDAKDKIVFFLENIRTIDINKETGRCKCAAEFKGEEYLQGRKDSMPTVQIYYTSEKTEDGKHYVTVSQYQQR